MNFARFSLAFGVIAQASVSIANFAIGFILVRVLDSAGFGEYGIGFALALLCASATNALLDTPATVIAGEYCNQERTTFQFSLISACLALCLFFMAIALVVIVLGAGAVYIGISAGVISAGLMCGAGLLMREVFVQMAFIESEDHIAAKINLIYMVTVLVAVAILGYTANISAHIALIANTVISLGCALVGGFMLRRYWFTPTLDIVCHWRKLYNHGKWSLGGVVVGWFHQQGFVYLVAGVAGVSAVGQLNAARLIVSPLLFLQTGMQNVVMPRVARLWDSDKPAGYKMARQLL
jgi:O-antigen/teichoic acid export membrane protein